MPSRTPIGRRNRRRVTDVVARSLTREQCLFPCRLLLFDLSFGSSRPSTLFARQTLEAGATKGSP